MKQLPLQHIVARLAPWLYAATMFSSALLLFIVQPMFAKMVLPLLGGTPAVWNVSLVFFQAALLVGYGYAHFLQSIKRVWLQVLIHAVLAILAGTFLPLEITQALGSPDTQAPVGWLFAVLTVSVGAPFALLSASAPLLQAWYSRTGAVDSADPYYLYVASNVGSIVALVSYPALVEPVLGVVAQSSWWSAGFVGVAGAILVSGALACRSKAATGEPKEGVSLATVRPLDVFRWVGLSAIPSGLLVSFTTHLTTDIASARLLWVMPLALYLVTFVVAFAKRRWLSLSLVNSCHIISVLTLAASLSGLLAHLGFSFTISSAAFFFASLACHSVLADSRPGIYGLTAFYLCISIGGVLGGFFSSIAAPILFTGIIEYPMFLALSLVATQSFASPIFTRNVVVRLLLIASAIPLLVVLRHLDLSWVHVAKGVVLGAAAFIALSLKGRPFALVLAAGLIFSAERIMMREASEYQARSFFGVMRVTTSRDGKFRRLLHGTTLHGSQALDEFNRLRPATYYAPEAPLGQALQRFATTGRMRSVGAIGLGLGSIACYRSEGQSWKFFEIDPLVVTIAKDERFFTYLRDCGSNIPILLGDGRLTLAQEPERSFDLLVIDAFSSDSVPMHLMTQEAIRMYMRKLSVGGVALLHISNRHLDLATPLVRIASSFGLAIRQQVWVSQENDSDRARDSEVVLLAESEEVLAHFDSDPNWKKPATLSGRPWSDDYTNIVEAFLNKQGGR